MSDEIFRWVIAVGVSLAALCIVAQAVVVLFLYGKIKALQVKVLSLMTRGEPIVDSVRKLVDENGPKFSAVASDVRKIVNENSPKVSAVATDVQGIVKDVRGQVAHVGEFVREVTAGARTQINRVDTVMKDTVDQVNQAGGAVKTAVLWPVREVNGLVNGLKAALSVYTHGRRASVDHATQDEEMFI